MSILSKVFSTMSEAGKAFIYVSLGIILSIAAYKTVLDEPLPTLDHTGSFELISASPDPGGDSTEDLLFRSASIPGDFSYSLSSISDASDYVRYHVESSGGGRGYLLSMEMIKLMATEHNRLKEDGTDDVDGFHVYFANRSSSGGEPAMVIMPYRGSGVEISVATAYVLDVDEFEYAPCPMECGDYNLLP